MANQWNITLDESDALCGEQAYKLFRQGKDVWNAFMAQHPKVFVNFNGFDFTQTNTPNQINFSLFEFPKGVSFSHAKFSNTNISFEDTKFGYGEVSFHEATFGNGGINFEGAKFCGGTVSFSSAKFGKGDISFAGANFTNSNIYFDHAKLSDGDVFFDEVEFENGQCSFFKTNFGNANISFDLAKFNKNKLSFSRSTVGNGQISFFGTKFGNSGVSFSNAVFSNCEVSFVKADFENRDVDLNSIQCKSLDFSDSSFSKSTQSNSKITFSMERAHISQSLLLPDLDFRAFNTVTFRGTYVGALFDIEGSQFAQLPDLTATTINGHFSVDRIHVETPKDFNEGDSTKARRLKELAKKSEDRKTQLDMLALELDAMTATKQIPRLSRCLNKSYKFISDYGRSILRPTIALAVVFSLSTAFYAISSKIENNWQDAVQLSFSQSLPFLSLSRTVTETSLIALYDTKQQPQKITTNQENTEQQPLLNNNWVENVGLLQNLLSYICLFFIGLGIRNRFKL
jgi:hypothetical protein